MLSRIVRHEWRSLWADATTLVVAAGFGLAIAYGVANGAGWVRFQQTALSAAAEEEAQRHASLQARIDDLERTGESISAFQDPRSASNAGGRLAPRYATLPPGALAPLAVGQSDLLPYYFKVSTDAREAIVSATEVENPQRLLAGRFDLAFVLIYFYPILILALSYNMLSAEQEQGTLSLALSQPVGLATLAAGKILLRGGLLLAVVVGCTLAALVVGGVDLGAAGAWPRLLLWVGAVVAYGAFWFAVALLVAARGATSASNAVVLASTWLVLVVVLPALFNLMATAFYPVPSRVEMVQAVRVASDETSSEGSTLLARYYEDHPELATGDADQAMRDFNVVRVAVNEEIERRVRPVVERYEVQIARQQGLMDLLRFVSPAVLMQSALYDVAGTGTARHRWFLAQVDRFHRGWREYFTPDPCPHTGAGLRRPATLRLHGGVDGQPRRAGPGEPAGLAVAAIAIAWLATRRLARFPVVA
ncbi:MAG: DUF3526 domain-containing protein [Vicinamibacterales bacterium]